MNRLEGPNWTLHPLKGEFDRNFANLVLPFALASAGVIIPVIRIVDKMPGTLEQVRLGGFGHQTPFPVHKLQTMPPETADTPGIEGGDDDRRTPLGKKLSKLHLDELLQALDVRAGHISVVGGIRPPIQEDEEWLLGALSPYDQMRLTQSRTTNRPGWTTPYNVLRDKKNKKADPYEVAMGQIDYAGSATFWGDIKTTYETFGVSSLSLVRAIKHHSGLNELLSQPVPSEVRDAGILDLANDVAGLQLGAPDLLPEEA